MGDLPPPLVRTELTRVWKKYGWKPRSYKAIVRRARELGIGSDCHGMYITITGLAELLGIPRGTVADWCQVGDTIPTTTYKRLRYIRRKDLREWARRNPRKLAFASRGNLLSALEHEKLTDWVLSHEPLRRVGAIKCLESGKVYPSCREAARQEYLHSTSISLGIRQGRSIYGKTFRRIGKRGAD